MLCGTNNANIVVLLLKDVTFIDDGKSLFPPSDKISPENSTQIFGNCKYLFLSPFPFNTDSSFQKHCILGYHCLFLFFSFFLESVRLFLFLLLLLLSIFIFKIPHGCEIMQYLSLFNLFH